MKKLVSLTLMIMLVTLALGQGVAINETGAEPDPSAMLDVTSTEKGILVPRITQAQRDAISNPATGLLIYQSDETPGFYYNAGSPATPLWKRIGEDLSQITGQWEKSLDNIFYNQGFVGVGTDNPEAKLDVSGGDVLIQGITAGRGGGNMTQNTVFGNQALLNNTDGERNTAIGYWTMYGNDTGGGDGDDNTAIGWSSMTNSSTGSRNTALGTSALTTNSAGHDNVALGYQALVENASGSANVAVGYQAGFEVNGGNNNILLGYRAGNNITTGSNNIIIGNSIEALPAGSNQMAIGAPDLLYGDLDSKRIGIGTTTPAALFHTAGTGTGEGNLLFEGEYKSSNPGDPPAEGAGTRMMWYPDKAAFRTGYVSTGVWDKNSIGNYSMAMGYNTKASGELSTAIGSGTTASGYYSTSMGVGTTASGYNSTAMGWNATASGFISTAMGEATSAKSAYETVIGRWNSDYTPGSTSGWNDNDRLFVIGNGTSTTDRSNAMTVLKNGNTGLGTDTPTALLHTSGSGTGEGNVLFQGTYKVSNPGDPPASGPGTRMMWYPDKAALRVGGVSGTLWDRDSIGDYSVAFGLNTKASGAASTAMGFYSYAWGNFSTAMGQSTNARGNHSTAMGNQTNASGGYSTAMGAFTTASGDWATAMGGSTNASGDWATAMGYQTNASGDWATAMGGNTNASGVWATAMGYQTNASGYRSTAMGGGTIASGDRSTATGDATTASGYVSTAMGSYTTASGSSSTAMGYYTTASGNRSTAMGSFTTAKSAFETVIGRYNTIYTPQDSLSWNASDRLFVIGNGTSSANRSNALTILKNGNAGFGVDIPTQKLDIDGQIRIRGGAPGNGKVLTSDANGVGSWQTPSYSNWTVSGSNIYRASGNVGIGTSAPVELLHVRNTSGTAKIRVQSTNISAIDFYNNTAYVAGIGVSVSEGHLFLYNGGNVSVKDGNVGIGNTTPGQKLDITAGNGRVQSGYNWLTNSDARYKTNVSTLENVLDKIAGINGVRYDLKEDTEIIPGHGKYIGFIAQELETEFPEFVVTGEDGFKSVAYDKMTAVLLQAIKEQQAIIDSHKEIIELLKQRIENLEEEK